ncbi:BTB/POZ protein [Rhizophagus clarus]|uniref:BTB/POZ protein n=1 Tax=Rhizophagus clarus TaxID=94130 RepID=A0A8H3L7K5_9GLOM|nr:BTB/POZ protein [Rhizophagus clarus]
MTSKFHSNLSKDFSLILNDADDYNVIIQVGEMNNTREFRAHSVIFFSEDNETAFVLFMHVIMWLILLKSGIQTSSRGKFSINQLNHASNASSTSADKIYDLSF